MYWFLILIGISDCSQKCFTWYDIHTNEAGLFCQEAGPDNFVLADAHDSCNYESLYLSPLWCSHWETESNRGSGLDNTSDVFTLVLTYNFGTQIDSIYYIGLGHFIFS